MRLSKKAEYALKALVALARRPSQTSMLIEDISETEKIPVKFLEQILLILRRAEILRSKRGLGGGYQLNRHPSQISLLEVISLVDGPFEPISCNLADPGNFPRSICRHCGLPGGCGLGKVFTEVQQLLNSHLSGITVADVVAREARQGELSFEI